MEDVFPIKNEDIPASYVSLPEGRKSDSREDRLDSTQFSTFLDRKKKGTVKPGGFWGPENNEYPLQKC